MRSHLYMCSLQGQFLVCNPHPYVVCKSYAVAVYERLYPNWSSNFERFASSATSRQPRTKPKICKANCVIRMIMCEKQTIDLRWRYARLHKALRDASAGIEQQKEIGCLN